MEDTDGDKARVRCFTRPATYSRVAQYTAGFDPIRDIETTSPDVESLP